MPDHYYVVTTPAGAAQQWNIPDYPADEVVAMGDGIYAHELGDGTEVILLLGTPTTLLGSPTVIAERTLAADEHGLGLYAYENAGVPTLAAVGYSDVWETTVEGVQTVVPISDAFPGWAPTRYTLNDGESGLRNFRSEYSEGQFLYGPEDAAVWATGPAESLGSVEMRPSYPGICNFRRLDFGELVYEELEADPPFVVEVTLTAQIVDTGDGDPSLYFSTYLDHPGGDGPVLPFEFWTNAVFAYTWASGYPAAGIPGGGTAETKLFALYGGSAFPIAGDSAGMDLAGNEDLALNGYAAEPGAPFYGLYPGWYVTPTTGPGYDADLSEGIESMTITGHYTVTPEAPWRETFPRLEYTWYPASDTTVPTTDVSTWGAPTLGGAPLEVTNGWARFLNTHWNAYAGKWRHTHYPYGARTNSLGEDDTSRPYFINDFIIATRFDDVALSTIEEAFETSRCRFVGVTT